MAHSALGTIVCMSVCPNKPRPTDDGLCAAAAQGRRTIALQCHVHLAPDQALLPAEPRPSARAACDISYRTRPPPKSPTLNSRNRVCCHQLPHRRRSRASNINCNALHARPDPAAPGGRCRRPNALLRRRDRLQLRRQCAPQRRAAENKKAAELQSLPFCACARSLGARAASLRAQRRTA